MNYRTALPPRSLTFYLRFCPFLSLCLLINPASGAEQAQGSQSEAPISQKHLIGPTTVIAETESELRFKARVDTGATTTSIHVEEWVIDDESPEMDKNVGKTIRFRIKNHRDQSEWLERKIEEITLVKTSAKEQHRYKVPVELRWNDISKEVMVTLNDRSHMKYQLLLGRNFLQGDFVVDVDLPKSATPVILVSQVKPDDASKTAKASSDTKAK